jgi:hypothetical protein
LPCSINIALGTLSACLKLAAPGASGRGRDAGGAGAGALAVLLILGFSSCKFDPKGIVNLGGSAFRTFDTGQISFLCEKFSTQLACRGAGVK